MKFFGLETTPPSKNECLFRALPNYFAIKYIALFTGNLSLVDRHDRHITNRFYIFLGELKVHKIKSIYAQMFTPQLGHFFIQISHIKSPHFGRIKSPHYNHVNDKNITCTNFIL